VASVQDILDQRDLGLAVAWLADPDAEVRWVATSELADPAPFLEGGELLLTTGLGTLDWRSQWSGYVGRLLEAGVVALGLGVGLTHRKPPAALVRACREQGLNLLVVPRETAFVAVSRSAARLIEHREEAQARAALEMQRELTAAASRQDARKAIVERLARLLDGEAGLVTAEGRVLTGSLSLDVRDALDRIRGHGLRGAITSSDAQSAFFLLPVGLRGRPAHYLAAVVPGRPNDGQRGAVTTAVALLSFVADQDRQRRDTRRALATRSLELLTHGEVESAAVVADAAGLGPLPARPQFVRATGPGLDEVLESVEERGLLAAVIDEELWVLAARVPELPGLRVGVGDSHRTAGLALARTSPAAPVVHWDQVVREGAVALVEPEVAASFATSFLGGLDEDQIETLGSFLRHHGSRLQVASELGVHRNTVRNRVEQIEAGLGRSLDDPDTRASAWLALQASQS
jgi:purine catabolism regulator